MLMQLLTSVPSSSMTRYTSSHSSISNFSLAENTRNKTLLANKTSELWKVSKKIEWVKKLTFLKEIIFKRLKHNILELPLLAFWAWIPTGKFQDFLNLPISLNRELSQLHVISHGEPSELSKERISQRKCCEQVSESEEQEL